MVNAKVADLTVDELKSLIRQVMEETLVDMLGDPDEGLELREEFKVALERSVKGVKEGGKTYSVEETAKRLGLEK